MADYLGLYCAFAFLIQLLFAFIKRSIWIRLIPMLGIAGCMILCMLDFFFVGEAYFLLYYMGWGIVLFSAGFAWIVLSFVRIFKEPKE